MAWHYDVDPASVAVIPCGVDLERFRPQDKRRARADLSLPPAAPILLFVGRLQPSKGIDTLLQAAADIRREYPDVCVLVVGGGLDDRGRAGDGRAQPPADTGGRIRAVQRALHQGTAPGRNWPGITPQQTRFRHAVALRILRHGGAGSHGLRHPGGGVSGWRPALHGHSRRFRLAGSFGRLAGFRAGHFPSPGFPAPATCHAPSRPRASAGLRLAAHCQEQRAAFIAASSFSKAPWPRHWPLEVRAPLPSPES